MAIYRKDSETIDVVTEAALEAGQAVKLADDFYGVPHCAFDAGSVAALQIEGQYDFVANGEVTAFAPVYIDSDGAVGGTSATGARVGLALNAAASGADVRVLLNK